MKINFWLLLVSSFLCSLSACGQVTYGIKKGYAFYKKSHPGTVMADDNGQVISPGVDTVHVLYLETTGRQMPVVDAATVNGNKFSAAVYPVTTLPVEVGRKKAGEELITLKQGKGNSLWKIELSPLENVSLRSKAIHNIRIKGKFQGRPFSYGIQRETELRADEHY